MLDYVPQLTDCLRLYIFEALDLAALRFIIHGFGARHRKGCAMTRFQSKLSTVTISAVFCASFATFNTASAGTVFDITGSSNYSGTITIDGGTVTSADVVVTGNPTDFTNVLPLSTQGTTDYFLDLSNTTTSPGPILDLPLDDGGTLVGFAGGTIEATATLTADCDLTSGLCRSIGPITEGSADLTAAAVGTTPLPAALPLFASGFGALGLFGWLESGGRKR